MDKKAAAGVGGMAKRLRKAWCAGLLLRMLVLALPCTAAPGEALPDDTASVQASVQALAQAFEREVRPRLSLPAQAQASYALALQQALDAVDLRPDPPQLLVLVDRSPRVQALMIWWGGGQSWQLIGASPVSTGLPGRYEHFATPLGVFEHSLFNPDFRAEGTKNELGIRGYGRKGMRVFDFGWVPAAKGWGNHGMSVMRLQMHATDPDLLERRLGSAQSKGCVRISASLNEFIDRRAVLDQDYEEELRGGRRLWVLREDRSASPWSGRYLVVIDSGATARPAWSPAPR